MEHTLLRIHRDVEDVEPPQTAPEIDEIERIAKALNHDLAAPVRGVSGFSGLLRKRYAEALGEEGLGLLEEVRSNARSLEHMLAGLVRYCRMEQSGSKLERCSLSDVFGEALAEVGAEWSDVEGRSEGWTGLPQVLGDRSQLREMFEHLLRNAIRFRGDEAPVVKVGAEPMNGRVVISFSDDGVGLPNASCAENLFEMFRTAHRQDEGAGYGLGLALVRRIVDRHGGECSIRPRFDPAAESESPGDPPHKSAAEATVRRAAGGEVGRGVVVHFDLGLADFDPELRKPRR